MSLHYTAISTWRGTIRRELPPGRHCLSAHALDLDQKPFHPSHKPYRCLVLRSGTGLESNVQVFRHQLAGLMHTRPLRAVMTLCGLAVAAFAEPARPFLSPTNIFAPASTPAQPIFDLSLFVLEVTAAIFIVVFSLLAYAVVKFRKRTATAGREPAQVYGSSQLELAWTVIPVLIVVILFLAAARVIAGIQNAERPRNAIEVTVIGHQFWWEYRYPSLKVVTANELHIPVSDPAHPTPAFLTLLSADTDHSFWVPRLAGKTDLIPNHPNSTWVDPHDTGLYLGQCAQYCGTQHAKMLLRVYVQSREDFDGWIKAQQQTAQEDARLSTEAIEGRRVFNATACVNCHAVAGTAAE